MWSMLARQWFLVALVGLIALGVTAGIQAPQATNWLASQVQAVWVTAGVLFLMSYTLDTKKLRDALRSPTPMLYGALLNMGLAPLLGWGLMYWQTLPDFRIGLLIAASVPCTMAAASVWTRKAHGNDAISLLVTLVTNIAAVLVTPYWLSWVLQGETTAANAETWKIDPSAMTQELLIGVLVPIILGQLIRQIPAGGRLANRYKTEFSLSAQVLILSIVLTAAAKGGVRIAQAGDVQVSLDSIVRVWGATIVVHVITLYAGLWLTRIVGLKREDQIAVAFAGSQKTLPVGLLISDRISQLTGLTFLVFPMLMFHASQLFFDTIIAERLAAEHVEPSHSTPTP